MDAAAWLACWADAGVYEDDVQVVRLSGSKSEDEPGVRVRVVI